MMDDAMRVSMAVERALRAGDIVAVLRDWLAGGRG